MCNYESTNIQSNRLVYTVHTGGHRQSYSDLLSKMFGLVPITGHMSYSLFKRLIRANTLIFSTLDDDMISFGVIALIRSVLRRPTVALFLRAEKCFESGKWHYKIKYLVFRLFHQFKTLKIVTISPFSSVPYYKKISTIGVFDPQYWDMHDGNKIHTPGVTDVSDFVRKYASGRRICCVLGALVADKGLSFIEDTLDRYPIISDRILFVFAGKAGEDVKNQLGRLVSKDALVIDRFISDSELLSLYSEADIIWACYEPHYNQASGVFGRAIQFEKLVIIRKGSIIEAFAKYEKFDYYSVEYDNYFSLFTYLSQNIEERNCKLKSDHEHKIGMFRHKFYREINDLL
jgi:hypothetical protein